MMRLKTDVHARAIEYCSNRRFHRSFTLPATQDHGKLRVTYALVGADCEDFEDDVTAKQGEHPPPTIVWCGAMFGSRWQGLTTHNLAKKMGVRVAYVDRPGMGGSSPVPLSQRLSTWLEIVPALVRILGVQHIVLASHSAGTIYLLNTLHTLRHVLSPTRPVVAMLAPWVHPDNSKATLMQLANYVPAGVLSHFNKVTGFIITSVAPSLSASASALTWSTTLTRTGPAAPAALTEPAADADGSADTSASAPARPLSAREKARREEQHKMDEAYGMDERLMSAVYKHAIRCMFVEDTTAGNEDAKLCLRKGRGAAGLEQQWGACDDYAAYVRGLAGTERQRLERAAGQGTPVEKMKVIVFFGETDGMIGQGGRKYFEECWDEQARGSSVEFESVVVKGTDHENVADPWRGNIERVFEEAKRSLEG